MHHDSQLTVGGGPQWLSLFLGHAPRWYKTTILVFLLINPLAWYAIRSAVVPPAGTADTVVVSWPAQQAPPASGSRVEIQGPAGSLRVVPTPAWQTGHGSSTTVRLEWPRALGLPGATLVSTGGAEPLTLPVVAVVDGVEAAKRAVAGFIVGWMLLLQFIFALAMALSCYPLLTGGLLALEALVLGICSVDHMYAEVAHNLPVILLLIFVVAGVHFLKDWLAVVFTALLFSTRSKIRLALMFSVTGALLSAFLDALTVTAVIIAVGKGFWDVYHAHRSQHGDHDPVELEQFRAFLRSLVMHAVIGTALGGVTTMVGEPQNLLIAHTLRDNLPPDMAGRWDFFGFMQRMAVVTVPTVIVGLLTVVVCERFRLVGYGAVMPERVRDALRERAEADRAARTATDRLRLRLQAICAGLLVAGLVFHWAEIGILGLFLVVLAAAFTGVSDEHRLGKAFTESMPFTALLVVFFAIVAMISEQGLFRPVVAFALDRDARGQLVAIFLANGSLSMVSDNVFVATVFINEVTAAYGRGEVDALQYEKLAVAINTGTNIPSVATPNGQAALLFLLTSALAAPIQLGYMRMLVMALPYTISLTTISLLMVWLFL